MRNARVGRHRKRLDKSLRRVDWFIWSLAGLAVAAVIAAATWAFPVL